MSAWTKEQAEANVVKALAASPEIPNTQEWLQPQVPAPQFEATHEELVNVCKSLAGAEFVTFTQNSIESRFFGRLWLKGLVVGLCLEQGMCLSSIHPANTQLHPFYPIPSQP